jgi:4-hydroxy-3-methylbut-2-enyl diphosphate reductase
MHADDRSAAVDGEDDTDAIRVDRVLLLSPRGFCAGVEMAIDALCQMIDLFGAPVYCYHQIVHNDLVIETFERNGVVFVDDIAEVPLGAPLLLSAHGTAPGVEAAAHERTSRVVNAVCPLVRKVHHEIQARADDGFRVVYVGHAGHDETVGATAVAPEATTLVTTADDVDRLDDDGRPVAFLAQTTLGMWEWQGALERMRERFTDVWLPARTDLCFATTNRQNALLAVLDRCDAVVVVGSATSSNTQALARLAESRPGLRVQRIDTADELDPTLTGTVAVTAGASVPELAVTSVLTRLAPREGVRLASLIDEDEFFPSPPELRNLVRHRDPSQIVLPPTDEATPVETALGTAVGDPRRVRPRSGRAAASERVGQ